MPWEQELEVVRDPNGVIRKRTTEYLGDTVRETHVRTTTYDENGKKQKDVEETFHRPSDDPRFRSNLTGRETNEYQPDGTRTKQTIELFGDGVNETPFSKIEYVWELDDTKDPPVPYLRSFRHYRWDGQQWVQTWGVIHNPDGSVDEASPTS